MNPPDDIEAAPTSKLLMSNSTTTTTLTSSNSTGTDFHDQQQQTNSIKLQELDRKGRRAALLKNTTGVSDATVDEEDETCADKSTNLLGLEMLDKKSATNNDNKEKKSELAQDGLDPEEPNKAKKESNVVVGLKLLAIFSTLYFFMWSSSILSQAFNLTSYHYAGHFIRTSGFLQNPLIGLMVGIITTVVFQSSGAVTSVLVTIVGSGVLTVRQSIPIIMGANLGTSVTNTVVSLFVYRKKQNFEIAMTAGIVHDMYNMMSVVFMLPLELLIHPLEYSSIWMLRLFGNGGHTELGEMQFLSYLVKPLVDVVIMIDKEKTSLLDPDVIVPADVSLVKRCCNSERRGNETICHEKCFSLFSNLDFSDNVVCISLLVIAMVTLFTCLVFVVKVTKSLLG